MSIRLENVNFKYDDDMPGAEAESPLIENLSLNINEGELVLLAGKTGSGKTSLLQLMAGIVKPNSGQVTIDDNPTYIPKGLFKKLKRNAVLPRYLGYVMQRPERQLFAETVFDDVAFGPKNLGLSENEVNDRVNKWLNFLSIENLSDKSPFEISGGQMRLVAIAGVLAMETKYLLLDEPDASLDALGRKKIASIIKEINKRGTTCVIATHNIDEAAAYAKRMIVLDSGNIVYDEPIDTIFKVASDDLENFGIELPRTIQYAKTHKGLSDKYPLTIDDLAAEITNIKEK